MKLSTQRSILSREGEGENGAIRRDYKAFVKNGNLLQCSEEKRGGEGDIYIYN
jgi:hypothetical protein